MVLAICTTHCNRLASPPPPPPNYSVSSPTLDRSESDRRRIRITCRRKNKKSNEWTWRDKGVPHRRTRVLAACPSDYGITAAGNGTMYYKVSAPHRCRHKLHVVYGIWPRAGVAGSLIVVDGTKAKNTPARPRKASESEDGGTYRPGLSQKWCRCAGVLC